jgi:GAF domain-containing protein
MADPPFDLLTRMARLISNSVEDADGCGITLLYRGEPITVAFSSELAALNDELQYTADAGPCLQAMRSQTLVECPDFAHEARWGPYPAAALGCGMRSVLSLPMDAAEAGHGALNLYSRTTHGFGEHDRQAALEFADVTAGVVAAARLAARPGSAELWRDGLARRTAVAQAVGILMARHECGRGAAFELLVRSGREYDENIHAAAIRIGSSVG